MIAELGETLVLLAGEQGCPGWCVLIDKHHDEHFDRLTPERQSAMSAEVALVAGALRRAFDPRRINYACLGNMVAHVHWHVIPRHHDDPEPASAVWSWSRERQMGNVSAERRAELVLQIRAALEAVRRG